MSNIEENVKLESILKTIGFKAGPDGYEFDFGNGKLKAISGLNPHFYVGYTFLGYFISLRSAGEIEFSLPLKVESYEQGIAFIAYHLRNTDLKIVPLWLNEGWKLKHLLPWERERKEYELNPKAVVEHEWFRLLVKKLRQLSQDATSESQTNFSFDGTVLKVECENEVLACGGKGLEWKTTATVRTKALEILPKKILKNSVQIFIWKGQLHIGNRAFELR